MLKLTIVENDGYANYVLVDKDEKKYCININFMEMEKPKPGTVIYIQEEVLDERVSLNYGPLSSGEAIKENELIIMEYDNIKKYLQRYYG